jgi:DNA primase
MVPRVRVREMLVRSAASPNDDRDRVRDAADIVRIVGKHIALKARGREFVGLCPFHDDHKPSMCVVPAKQIYHCFSCGAGGDVFTFVQKYHAMDFREALEYLASETNIELTPYRPQAQGDDDQPTHTRSKADLLRASQAAAAFFRTILAHEEHGRRARDMIAQRGISDDMVEQFAMGAAPDRWDGLLVSARAKGIDIDALAEAGLLKSKEQGDHYDTFRNRLIFPIHDQIGRVIAFGGRRLSDDDPAKYLNSPESRLFDKSATLFGLHQASREIQTQRTAVVVEGYTDVIACHQAGFTNVVATLGTALTPGHAATLRRLCDTIILLFDGDAAGTKAASRAVQVFFAEPIDVRIAALDQAAAKDPDELLKQDGGKDQLAAIIDSAEDALRVLFRDLARQTQGQGISARSRITEEFVNQLVELGVNSRMSPVRRRLIIRTIADITGTDWQTIASIMPAGRKARPRTEHLEEETRDAPPEIGPREHLLGCVLCEPSLLTSAHHDELDLLEPERFGHPHTRAIAQTVAQLRSAAQAPSLQNVLARLDHDAAKSTAVSLATRVETETEGQRVHEHWRAVVNRINRDATARAPTVQPAATSEEPGNLDQLMAKLAQTREVRESFGSDTRALPGHSTHASTERGQP